MFDDLSLSPAGLALIGGMDCDDQTFKALVMKAAQNIHNYDDNRAAGRALIYRNNKACPNVTVYLEVNRHILSDLVINFLGSNPVDDWLSEFDHLNYRDQDFFSASTLIKSYLLRPLADYAPCETPLLKNLRIAIQLHSPDVTMVKQVFLDMSEGLYTHASPTIFNAGTKRPQMSSCFLMEVDDNLNSIIRVRAGDMAEISRSNGGIGVSLSRIRHSTIGFGGKSSGVVPVGKVYDELVGYVDQGGKRNGAVTGFLDVAHIDVVPFIKATDNFGSHQTRYHTLNTCLWMRDLFYRRLKEEGMWTMFCPSRVGNLFQTYGEEFEEAYVGYEELAVQQENELASLRSLKAKHLEESDWDSYTKTLREITTLEKTRVVADSIPAVDLMNHIISLQGKSGNPYMMNADAINYKSNHKNLGAINGSNLCLEILEWSQGEQISSCNLASINLAAFARHPPSEGCDLRECYDFKGLREAVQRLVVNLDQVIERNHYPIPEKTKALNFFTRPLGIGVSGLDDAFKIMDMAHGEEPSLDANRKIFAAIYHAALTSSHSLAVEKGCYPAFGEGSYHRAGFVPNTDLVSGSPLSHGQFQFDLWEDEARMLESKGQTVFGREFNAPVDPELFGVDVTWEQLRKKIMSDGVRNSLLIALMPTASTAQLFRNAESTEAHQANIYSRQVQSGSYTIVNRHLHHDLSRIKVDFGIDLFELPLFQFIIAQEGSVKNLTQFVGKQIDISPPLKQRLQWLERKYLTMFEIKTKTTMMMARQRAIYVCQSQSMNIFIKDPSSTQKRTMHIYANSLRLKTGMYYLRQLPTISFTGFDMPASVMSFIRDAGSGQSERRDDCMVCSA